MLTMKTTRSLFLLLAMLFASTTYAATPAAMEAVNSGDYATAITLLAAEAEDGDADAQYQLGLLHDSGQGVEANEEAAIAYMQMAASQEQEAAIEWLVARDIEPEGNPEDDC